MNDAPPRELGPGGAFALALAIACIGEAIVAHDGEYSRRGLAWLAAALIGVVFALRPSGVLERMDARSVTRMLGTLVGLGFLRLLSLPPSGRFAWSNDLRPTDVDGTTFHGLVASALALGVLAFWLRETWRRVLVGASCVVFVAAGAWVIRASPYSDAEPRIDVMLIQQESASALLRGENPYALTFRDIYETERADKPSVYGEGLVANGRLRHGYHYPPVSLVGGTLGFGLLGDVRYAALAAMALVGLLLYVASPGRIGLLLALAWWFQSRGFFVLGRGWTDAYVVLAFVGWSVAHARGSRLAPWLLGLLFVSKQHLIVLAPLLPLVLTGTKKERVAYLGRSAIAAALVLAPFVAWDPRAFFHSVVDVHLAQPFRFDALSFTAWLANTTGVVVGSWLAFLLLVPAYAFAWRFAPRGVAGFALASAFVLLVFVAFNKQAFANYLHAIVGIGLGGFATSPVDQAPSSKYDTTSAAE
ncbi:MAG: hypothetical protein JNL94_05335 [Planctomycetes bacterium]|nr:hypothetical protein [Planctomycetota bacterium]